MGRIFDAVYGYIELDEVEFALVNSPIFQRLHWIKQLGPLHVVFPSAQHSRFSHSIGVYHIVKKMIGYIEGRKDSYKYSFDKDKKALKLAALLHDIGHVPFSHIGERALQNTVQPKIKGTAIDAYDSRRPASWQLLFKTALGTSTKLHEALSAEIVLHDEQIDKILKDDWPNQSDREKAKERIAGIIVGRLPDVPTLLLHSELDADRLDFLLRDSFFTGVDYGKIDLDYIISRLGVVNKGDGHVPELCVEKKGLHTVEHYILGRFFLQTQIIYYRKVRLMDMLCADVMEYMVASHGETWGIMNLRDLVQHIRHSDGDPRGHLHEIYAYTDAQVFSRMRILHEELDKREKANTAKQDEIYINNCIKIIMDGQIPEPVVTHQRLVDLGTNRGENFERTVEDEAKRIAEVTAKTLKVDRRQIKPNIVMEETMKYQPRMEGDEEANREAVRITYKSPDEKDEIIPAAKSDASILQRLADRALAIFNVFYIPYKNEGKTEVKSKEETIKKAYQDFISQHFPAQTTPCGCESGRHMCQIIRERNGLKEAKALSKGAKHICEKCGRVSSDETYLCAPVEI